MNTKTEKLDFIKGISLPVYIRFSTEKFFNNSAGPDQFGFGFDDMVYITHKEPLLFVPLHFFLDSVKFYY